MLHGLGAVLDVCNAIADPGRDVDQAVSCLLFPVFECGIHAFIDLNVWVVWSFCSQPSADHLAVQKQELQACLLKQFVWRLRHCEHVTAESMTNIRAMCRRVGWEYPGAPDMQQDAGEFFAFLHGCLGGQLIRTTRRTFTGALPDNSDRGHEENMALLPVALCNSHPQRNDELNLSSLVDTFFFENVAAGLRRKVQGQQQEVYALNT